MSVHRQTLAHFVRQYGWTRGAELGVDKGILFGMTLNLCPDLTLIGVDVFPDKARSHRVFELEQKFAPRAIVLNMTTAQASRTIEDGSLDFVFVDADHSYEAVQEDIALWKPKVKAGGWLGGHDYHTRKFPGVVQAVNEAFGGTHHEMPGTIWGVWV